MCGWDETRLYERCGEHAGEMYGIVNNICLCRVCDVLKDPFVAAADKKTGLTTVLTKLGVDQHVQATFSLLAENNRWDAVADVVSAYGRLVEADGSTAVAVITSAEALEASYVKEISGKLQRLFVGQKLQVETVVDPSAVDGLFIKVGDVEVDLTVKSQVDKLTSRLEALCA